MKGKFTCSSWIGGEAIPASRNIDAYDKKGPSINASSERAWEARRPLLHWVRGCPG